MDNNNFSDIVQRFSDEFDALCQERHTTGQQKYGELTFLQNNTLEMALEELADMTNYFRYTAIRTKLLMLKLEQLAADMQEGEFVSTGQAWNKETGKAE